MRQQEEALYAIQILENPLWPEFLNRLKERQMVLWQDEANPEQRERIWNRVQGLRDIENLLEMMRQELEREEPAA